MERLQSGSALRDPLAPYRDVERKGPADRPWVLANMVAGLDGTAAVGGRVGDLSDQVDRDLFLALRTVADVVLVGAETVRRERYGPVRLRPELMDERRRAGRPEVPRLAILSRSLSLDPSITAFADARPDARPLVVTCEASSEVRRARLASVADIVVAGDEVVDLPAALRQLAPAGSGVVLNEGGPTVLGELVAGGLLDELCLTVSAVMGGDPLPVAIAPPLAPLSSFRLEHVLRHGDSLFLRYERATR